VESGRGFKVDLGGAESRNSKRNTLMDVRYAKDKAVITFEIKEREKLICLREHIEQFYSFRGSQNVMYVLRKSVPRINGSKTVESLDCRDDRKYDNRVGTIAAYSISDERRSTPITTGFRSP
jgi:hypothetical protein